MVKDDHPSETETDGPSCEVISCPFCEHGSLEPSRSDGYVVCCECHRKVFEARVSAVRLELLLDAFDELLNNTYEKELLLCAERVRGEIDSELRQRGFGHRTEAHTVVSVSGARGPLLTPTALQALNEMLHDYDFGEGKSFLENVLNALHRMDKLTADQSRLRRQLEAVSPETRESLSGRIRVTQHS